MIIALVVAFGVGALGAHLVPYVSAHKSGQSASDLLQLSVEGSQVVVSAISDRTYLLLGISKGGSAGEPSMAKFINHSDGTRFDIAGRDRIIAYELVATPVKYIDLTRTNPVGIVCTEAYCPVPPWPPVGIENQLKSRLSEYSPEEYLEIDYGYMPPGEFKHE
jgi:hypothetical protein